MSNESMILYIMIYLSKWLPRNLGDILDWNLAFLCFLGLSKIVKYTSIQSLLTIEFHHRAGIFVVVTKSYF